MAEAVLLGEPLPPAPAALAGDAGAPRAGLYGGTVAEAGFASLQGDYAATTLQRLLMEKKWHFVSLATPDFIFSIAIVDAGYLASGFCAVFDRGARRLLIDDNPVLPPLCATVGEHPADGGSARLVGPGIKARIERSGGRILVSARWHQAAVDLALDARRAPPPITAIAPVGEKGRFDLTQKTVLLPAEGEIRAANVRFAVQGAFAGHDFTHGFLPRETAWRWAFASGRAKSRLVAFNFSEGFLQGAGENAVWIEGEPRPAGKVSFTFDGEAPLSPWHIRSADGAVDLVFQPEGYRAQSIDLKLISSKYLQPFGVFSGKLNGVEIDRLAGICEDHAARW
jgi:hypothetical protein